jgi:hypothetical protein
MEFSRRAFLGTGVAALAAAQSERPDLRAELRGLISQGDLIYDKPATRSEAGIPIGNGRMGTLVWTTPTSIRMQINRVDVYANNSATNSFVERHNDYCGDCGFLDVDFGNEVFPETGFRQHLSIYDGLLTIQGKGVEVRIAASPAKDCIAVEISGGHRTEASLRVLRFESKYAGNKQEAQELAHISVVTTRNHTATSQLSVRGQRMVLTQEFREADFCCKSAVVVGTGKARVSNEMEARLTAGSTVLIGTSASFDPNADVAAIASTQLDGAAFTTIAQETRAWWHAFWQKGWVRLSSKDGSPEFVAANYHYCLYLMGATSRGKYPTKFNGMLWNTNGDQRTWGAQHWFTPLPGVRHAQAPAFQPLELDFKIRMGERRVRNHRTRLRPVRQRQPHHGQQRQDSLLVLAPLRVHAGHRLAAQPRLSDAERRRRVLPQLPQREQRRRRPLSHQPRQQ